MLKTYLGSALCYLPVRKKSEKCDAEFGLKSLTNSISMHGLL